MKKEPMECPACKEISLKHINTETDTSVGTFEEWECESCRNFVTFDVPAEKDVDVAEQLRLAIFQARDILDNDLYVSRAVNCREILQDALDTYGYPDVD